MLIQRVGNQTCSKAEFLMPAPTIEMLLDVYAKLVPQKSCRDKLNISLGSWEIARIMSV